MNTPFHLVAAGLLAAAALSAQGPSNWTTMTLPANLVSGPNQIGTSLSLQTTTDVWLYSGITKEWTVLPVTNPAPLFQANDYIIVQDGNQVHGYATHTGRVDTITTPTTTPTIISGSSSSSWVTLVADGAQAWAFGAFHGRWETTTLAAPNPTMVASRLTGLISDGTTVWGVSAHHGTLVPVPGDAQAVPVVVGEAEVGTANSPGVFRGFSAQQNSWGVQAVPMVVNTFQEAEYAIVDDGTQAWGFSGITGTFDHFTATSGISGLVGAAGVAAFQDGSDAVCFGSGTGSFVARPAPNFSGFHLAYHFAVVIEGSSHTPFSALLGAYGPTAVGNFVLTSNDAICFADGSPGQSLAYSPILNTWYVAPVVSPLAVEVVRDSVVLAEPTGYQALSARHGTWVQQTTSLPASYVSSTRGSTFVAVDGTGEIAHVFDARLNRWATAVGQNPLAINISRHTAMAHDGVTAFGFGQPSGEWYSEPLTAAPTSFRTSSSIGTLVHGNELSVYSVQGSFTYTGRYPEFTQAINLGNTLRLHQVAPPGSVLTLVVGFAPARIDLGPTLGFLYMDPMGLVSVPWGGVVGSGGLAEFALPVPNDPNLRTTQLHFQDVVIPPTPAMPWLSNSVAPILF